MLRRIFGPKSDKVTREWRKLHYEELNDTTSSPIHSSDQFETNEMGGACSMYLGQQRCMQGSGGET